MTLHDIEKEVARRYVGTMLYVIFIILYAIFDRVQVVLIGTMTVSEIFSVFAFAYLLLSGEIKSVLEGSKDLSYVTRLYICLFFIQLIAELFVGNTINNALKGMAVTIVSYAKVMYMLVFFSKYPHTIKWYLVGTIMAGIMFTTPEEEVSMADVFSTDGKQVSFFKFKVAPLLTNGLVALSLFEIRKPVPMHILFIIVGMMDIVLGARSTGLLTMLVGCIAYVVNFGKAEFTKKKIISWSVVGCLALYPLYCVYVNAVLSGTINGGNSHDQLQKVSNPYNPLGLLMEGRTESASSLVAIYDSPLVGHGAWAPDPGYKYHKIMNAAHGLHFDTARMGANVIPSHSVILGYGVNEGIFAMIVVIMIIWFFMKRGGLAIYKDSPYIYLLLFCITQLVWNSLFSPVSHFRNGFPYYFVCCYLAWVTLQNDAES